MTQTDGKLNQESIEQMLQCRISTVKPFVLMLTPVYVFMKRNQKLVSVKAPLDFFTPEELDHLSIYENFYVPKTISMAVRFQTAAKVVRSLISPIESNALERSPFEKNFEIQNLLASLWGNDLKIDSFFASIFTDELCGSVPSQKLISGRDQNVIQHEFGILLSGLLIFTLINLGITDLETLIKLRTNTYLRSIEQGEWETIRNQFDPIARDLAEFVASNQHLNLAHLSGLDSEWAKKLSSRLRVFETSGNYKRYESLTVQMMGVTA